MKNKEGLRRCTICKEVKELNDNNFYKCKSRYLGFGYRCKNCDNSRKDERRGRYAKLSTEQRIKVLQGYKDYKKTDRGKARVLLLSYKSTDRKSNKFFDLDLQFILDNIIHSNCVYCGTTKRLGCERKDNSKGHTKDNVVPACAECNIARMDNFTHEEMFIIGDAIRKVRKLREEKEI